MPLGGYTELTTDPCHQPRSVPVFHVVCRILSVESSGGVFVRSGRRCRQLRRRIRRTAHARSQAPHQSRKTDGAAARTAAARPRGRRLRPRGAPNPGTSVPCPAALRRRSDLIISTTSDGGRPRRGIPADGPVPSSRGRQRVGTVPERSNAGPVYAALIL